MTQGYYAGISGIQTHQYGLDVISDNLANIGTVGFKGAVAEFSDLLSKNMAGDTVKTPTSDDIGYGVNLQTTSYQLQQGEFSPSERYSDLAIDGNGWFGVTAQDKTYFTRDGHFSFDVTQEVDGDINSSAARLVTADGMYVTGTVLNNFAYDATFDYGDLASMKTSGAYVITDPTGTATLGTTDKQTSIALPTRLAYPVVPTTKINFMGNLGIDDVQRVMNGEAINALNETNQIKLVFTKSATQPTEGVSWDVTASVMSKDGNTVYDTQNGQALFDSNGAILSFTIPTVDNNGSPVTIDFGKGYAGVISNNGVAISGGSQSDGYIGGNLTKYAINTDGVIIADFTNGRQSAIGRIAVYHFQNDQGLNRDGGTYFTETSNSGKPMFWNDANGNTITGAVVKSGYLEASNVRIEVGLTDMIVMQRAYQANAKTITTVDEMIQKALQMHR
ncbi:MAG: flagellar hook-basal body complex protein [Sulfuricurvum sp.]|nr:flagellar hook-basal body complex protein [Sulfuricurvum sp.]